MFNTRRFIHPTMKFTLHSTFTPHPITARSFKSRVISSLFIVLLMMIVVSGDDTQALRDTISSLCSLNKVGYFAKCCANYSSGASITLEDSPARSCFIAGLTSTTGSVLTSLFVICFILVLFLFDDCHCFFFISHFQEFSIQRTFCFRGGYFLQSHKSPIPLPPSSHSLHHSFLSFLSIILEFSIQQSCFN